MKVLAFDTETTGLNCYTGDDHIFAYATCDSVGNTEVYRMDNNPGNAEELQKLFDDTSVAKCCHNLKFDLAMVEKYGIRIPEKTVFHDTMIMSQLLNNLRPKHGLDALAYELGGWGSDTDNLVAKITKGGVTYDKVPEHIMDKYQREDVERTMLLFLTFYPEIEKDPKLFTDYRNEIDLIRVTISEERRGILLDRQEAVNMIMWLEDEVHGCYEKLHALTGERLNYKSPDQVNYLLFKKLGIPPTKKKKRGYSTEKDVMFQLREDYLDKDRRIWNVLDQLARYRSYSGAIPRIRKYIKHSESDGTIHPSINTNRAVTGRESVKDPPLQGVSKNQNLFNPYPVPMRKLFKSRKGYVLYLPDYSGIEMRLIVDVADEPEMTDIFLRGDNSHEVAAKLFYGDRFINKKESKDLYSSGKNAHFALPYGASKYKLAKTLGLPMREGVLAYERYEKRFPRIAHLSHTLAAEARENGFIITSFGRKLFVPADSLHAALNYRIQGTGAGILKRAQTRLHRYYQKHYNGAVRLILPIHDELVIEYPREYLADSQEFIRDTSRLMTTFDEFKIPLESEWKMTTTTWFNAEDL